MKKKLYIIAHTCKDVELTIDTFYTPHKAVKKLGEMVHDGFEKPNPDDDPEEYLDRYNDWRDAEDIDFPDYAIELKVLEI